jgi:hypothetical protein
MKRIAILAAVTVATMLGCKPADERVPRAGNAAAPQVDTAAPSASTTDRVEAQDKLAAALKKIDAQMADLKARAQTAGDQAKAEWEARRPQLETQRDAASKKLDELKVSSKETWGETRTKTEAAFAELEKGFKEAWAKLKE